MNDLLWFAFIAACALAGIGLTLLWIRVRSRTIEDVDLDQLERALKRRGPPRRTPSSYRPPPPTPDLISIQEAWRAGERAEADEADEAGVFLDGLGRQDRGTPTAPSGPRQGWQLPPEVVRAREADAAQREATAEATVIDAKALDPSELDAGEPSSKSPVGGRDREKDPS